MIVARQNRRSCSQRADGDDEIGERQYFAGTIQTPGEFRRIPPGAMIHGGVNEQVKKIRQIFPGPRSNHPAQYFASHQIASDNFGRLETRRQFRDGINAAPQQINVNGRINEKHAGYDISRVSPRA